MTADKGFKRLIRERVSATGESYATARRHLLLKRSGGAMTDTTNIDAPVGFVALSIHSVHHGRIGVGHHAASVGLVSADGRYQHHIVTAEQGDVIEAALAGNPPANVVPDLLWRARREEGRIVSVAISCDLRTGVFSAVASISRDDGPTLRIDCAPPDALVAAALADPTPAIFGPTSLLVRFDRPVGSDFSCPECGANVSQSIIRGPLPVGADVDEINRRSDGLLVHEPDLTLSEPQQVQECAEGHRYLRHEGVPRRPWLPPRDDDPRP